jgi:hypothetical protein
MITVVIFPEQQSIDGTILLIPKVQTAREEEIRSSCCVASSTFSSVICLVFNCVICRIVNCFICHLSHGQLFICHLSHLQLFHLSSVASSTFSSVICRIVNFFICHLSHLQLFHLSSVSLGLPVAASSDVPLVNTLQAAK